MRKPSLLLVAALLCSQGARTARDETEPAWRTKTSRGGQARVTDDDVLELRVDKLDQEASGQSREMTLPAGSGTQVLMVSYRSWSSVLPPGERGCALLEAVARETGEGRSVLLPCADRHERVVQLPLDFASPVRAFRVRVAVRERTTRVAIRGLALEEASWKQAVVHAFDDEKGWRKALAGTGWGTAVAWTGRGLRGRGALDVRFDASALGSGRKVRFRVEKTLLADAGRWDAVMVDVRNLDERGVRLQGRVTDEHGKQLTARLSLRGGEQGRLILPVAAMREAGLDVSRLEELRLFVWSNERPVHLLVDSVRLVRGEEPLPGVPIERERRGPWTVLRPTHLPPLPEPSPAEASLGVVVFQRSASAMIFPWARPTPDERVSAARPLEVALAGGEFEPVQVGLCARRVVRELRVRVAGLDEMHPEVRFVDYLQLPVGQSLAKTSSLFPADLLQRPAVNLDGDSCAAVWITFRAEEVAAGSRRGKLVLSAGRVRLELPIVLRVHAFELPAPGDKVLTMLYTNTYFGLGRGGDREKILERGGRDLDDFARHGMTSVSPEIWTDYVEVEGRPFFPELETLMLRGPEHGLKGPVLWYCGAPFQTQKAKHGRKRENWEGLAPPSVPGAASHERRELAWTHFNHDRDLERLAGTVRHLRSFARSHALPEPVFLPIDEPAIEPRVVLARDVLRAVKQAGGRTALAGSWRALGGLLEHVDLVIHQGAPSRQRVRQIHDAGRRVIFYDNASASGPYHHRARVLWGVNVWHTGLDGASAWTHLTKQGRYRTRDVLSHRRAGVRGPDHSTVPNLNWEMIREGVDDLRYVLALEQAARVDPELRERADALFATMHRTLLDDPSGYQFVAGVLAHPPEQAAPSPSQLDSWRHRMAVLLEEHAVRSRGDPRPVPTAPESARQP